MPLLSAPLTGSTFTYFGVASNAFMGPGGGGGAPGKTWHLGILDAGNPKSPNFGANQGLIASRLNTSDGVTIAQATWLLEGNNPQVVFGSEDALPVSGDWDGDGSDNLGIFIEGLWLLDLNGDGLFDRGDLWARLGNPGDQPVVGDWDGDGKDDIGIYGPEWAGDALAIHTDPGLPNLENELREQLAHDAPERQEILKKLEEHSIIATRFEKFVASAHNKMPKHLVDHVFSYSEAEEPEPVSGDWNGDGTVSIGTFANGKWFLDVDGDGRWNEATDREIAFGRPGDQPAVGDWNGDGIDDLAVYRAGHWHLDSNANQQLDANDRVFAMGEAGDRPVVGDWNGDGIDEPGVYSLRETVLARAKASGDATVNR